MSEKELIKHAISAMEYSYSPYSDFRVGAALLTKDGKIYTGCNIENSAYSPCVCAERCALFKAVSEGERDFEALAVIGGYKDRIDKYSYPCGVCRQVLSEFCDDDFKVIIAKSENDYIKKTLGELLPDSFSINNLK